MHDEPLDRGLGHPQSLPTEAIAQEVEALPNPADEGRDFRCGSTGAQYDCPVFCPLSPLEPTKCEAVDA